MAAAEPAATSADCEAAHLHGDPVAALEHWLGPGRTLTLARYELFLMAARDPALRAPLLQARDRYVAVAAAQVGGTAAPTVVAAVDGVLLDALVRGSTDSHHLRRAVAQIVGSA